MKTIIVDDEIKAIDLLEYHLTEFFDDFNIIGKYTNINDALINILKNNPDVVFLDINMPNGSGIELLQQLSGKNILTVFCTAHTEYAIEAIKLEAFDYLLKPINIAELNRVHLKLSNKLKARQSEKPPGKIKIKAASKFYVFDPKDIINISSEGNYTTIYSTNNSPILISKNLKKVEEEYFSDLPFFRCHQSNIININHVKNYSSNQLILSNDNSVIISNIKLKEFITLV